MVSLTITKNTQDFIMALMSATVAALMVLKDADAAITPVVVIGCVIVFLNALIDINKKSAVVEEGGTGSEPVA